MNKELLSAIEYLSKEKGVAADVICESLEAVLITALYHCFFVLLKVIFIK